MFKIFVVFAACFAYAAAGVLHPSALAVAPAAYANAPLYAAGGSQQIDVRHNYDGTLSSYTTTPFGYTSPISSRYVAGGPAVPAAFAAPAPYATAPFSYAAPAAYSVPAGVVNSPYAALASPFAAPYHASYPAGVATSLASPFVAAPAKVVV